MNPFAISNLLILITSIPLGYFVYQQNKSRWVNKIWLIYSVTIAIWGLFGLLIAITSNQEMALLYWRLAMGLGIVWMPVLFHHFAFLYAPWQGRKEKLFLIGAYTITAILAVLIFTSLFVDKVRLVFDSFYYAVPEIAFHIMIIWWFAFLGYSHTKLYLSSRQMPIERQNQIKLFLAASITAYLGGFLDFGIAYQLDIYPWGNFLVAIYPFLMTYAIIKHGLFDIFIFIRKTFITAVIIAIIAWAIPSVGAVNEYLDVTFGLSSWVLPILAGILAVYIGHLFLKNINETEKAKEEFVTVAAHKLRTPLTHIRHIADELTLLTKDEYGKELVAQLKKSNFQLIELVNKLLNITNLETRTEHYNFIPFDLQELTEEIIKRLEASAKDKEIKLVLESEANLLSVEGNRENTDFVVQSLIENAVLYTPKMGEIKITIKSSDRKVIWSVTDSGIGIASGDLGQVFEKFFRSDKALLIDTEGTGLALYMSRNLIKRQGGALQVESAGEGQGSHFWFTLPIYRK